MPNDNGGKRKYGDNTAPRGRGFDMRELDPSKVDDFRERIKREEEERKRNQSSSQSGSKSGK